LLARLGYPETHYACVHIGGTNGKGSVATLIAEALRVPGRRVGLYTSPHLVDVRERMLVDGRPISREAFAGWTTELRTTVIEAGASFFEATTAIALADFAARGVDIAVIEVGLGGRLDATNVLDSLVSAVTQIGMDHADYLGDSLEGIAREKAGIAKPGRPFVIGETDPALRAVLVQAAEAVGATPIVVDAAVRYTGALRLAGPHQRRNAAVAHRVLETLPRAWRPSNDALTRAFARASIPGRMERRGPWLFDVAHNPSGVAVLVAALRTEPVPLPVHALVAILADKDWRAMIEGIASVVQRVWVTVAPSAPPDRVWSLAAVAADFPDVIVEADFDRALRLVQDGAGTTLVTGSFHTVGDAMARLPGFAPLG
jgi:dihydrofolate synthase/folylpolyglutamate synthase